MVKNFLERKSKEKATRIYHLYTHIIIIISNLIYVDRSWKEVESGEKCVFLSFLFLFLQSNHPAL